MEKKKKLTGSFPAKAAAYFLLAVSAFIVSFCAVVIIVLFEKGYYTSDPMNVFLREAEIYIRTDAYTVRDYLAGKKFEYAKRVCEGKNYEIALLNPEKTAWSNNEGIIWATFDYNRPEVTVTAGDDADLSGWMFCDETITIPLDLSGGSLSINGCQIEEDTRYIFRFYFDPEMKEHDKIAEIYTECCNMQQWKIILPWICGISVIVMLLCFLFLMCGAGHRNNAEGIQRGVFFKVPFDLYAAFYGTIVILLLLLWFEVWSAQIEYVAMFSGFVAMAFAVVSTFFLTEFAVRLKVGGLWTNTVICRTMRFVGRAIRTVWRGVCAMFRGFPLILNTLIAYCGIVIMEFFGVCLFMRSESGLGLVLWLIEKLVLLLIVVYTALMCKRLLKGSEVLAEGRQDQTIDTSYMFGDLKVCADHLNSIGQGISKAVEERMKSERMKTELITNVSHDIKTPLTSIINYANLIAKEPSENEEITEYAEVLVRQSGRLKKLLEDLVEASKAASGNVDVDLRPCEVSVILSQAIGEYQQKMEEKRLELIVTQPKEEVSIMADGKHLWRVFDNLLNNICKYAREDSRVYLNVDTRGGSVDIIFRNMSKYALNVDGEELKERFVRGDKSRHMEGNGLGLSIAKSLTELQNGRMEVVTDGDLFKVILGFAKV